MGAPHIDVTLHADNKARCDRFFTAVGRSGVLNGIIRFCDVLVEPISPPKTRKNVTIITVRVGDKNKSKKSP